MSTIYVRTSGSDTIGDGTLTLPYRTIGKASTVWTAHDLIDVGEGEFAETAALSLVSHGAIRGAGAGKTIVRLLSTALRWVYVNDLTTLYLAIGNLTIDQTAANTLIVKVAQAAPSAQIVLARAELRLQSAYAVDYSATEATARVDVLNCYLNSRWSSPAGIAFRSTVRGAITVRNTIVSGLALVVDDLNGGYAIDLDYNLYYGCDRLLRIGTFGMHDILDQDPQLESSLTPALSSPARNSGVPLSPGYGDPVRVPPEEFDWGYHGRAPEIGPVETIEAGPTRTVRAAVIGTIVDAFGLEMDGIRADLETRKGDRFIDTASPSELQRRFGTLLAASRPAGWTDAQYAAMLAEVLELARSGAPSRRVVERVVDMVWSLFPIVRPYRDGQRFRLGSALKVQAKHTTPGDATLTARVLAGTILWKAQCLRVKQTDIVVPASSVSYLYVDGTLLADGTLQVKTSTSTTIPTGLVEVVQTGTAWFRQDETRLVGLGTSFTSLTRHDSLSPSGSRYRYMVESVTDDDELTLRTPFRQEDYSGPFVWHRPVVLIGTVGTNGTTIVNIWCGGRLGVTTYLDGLATAPQSCLVYLTESGQIDLDDNDDVNLTLSLLALLRSVHRRMSFGFVNEYPIGKIVGAVRSERQTSVAYLESAEDSSWPES